MPDARAEHGATQLRAIALVLALLATIGLLLATSGGRQPWFHGRPILDWVADLGTPGDQSEAQTAIRSIGPKAIPFLFKEVRRGGWRSKSGFPALPPKLQELLPTADFDLCMNKIPLALSLFGKEGLPMLLAATHDRNEDVQWVAVHTLEILGPAADSALPTLLQLIAQTNDIRAEAALAIAQLGPIRKQAVPALIAAMPGNESAVMRALSEIGSDAAPAVPALTALLESKNEVTRIQAARALWEITHDPHLVAQITPQLEKKQGYRCYIGFLDLLAEIGPAAKPAIPTIEATMPHWGPNCVPRIQGIIRKIDPDAATDTDTPLR